MTDRERLEFAVEFLNKDVPKMRQKPGDLPNFNYDASHFMGRNSGDDVPTIGTLGIHVEADSADTFSIEEIEDLQREIRRLLMHAAPQGWTDIESSSPNVSQKVLKPEFAKPMKPITITPGIWPGFGTEGVGSLYFAGSLRDAFVLQVVLLLTQPGQASVRLCARPDCGQWFVREKRQEYCSRRCSNLIASRKRRDSQTEEQKKQEYGKAYERRVKKRVGENAKVKINRRKPDTKK